MNKICQKRTKNAKSQKFQNKDPNLGNKLHSIITPNGFNIIELNEEDSESDMISDLSNISEREIDRIKKKAQMIESYYMNKGEETRVKENCFNCLMSDFLPNELVYFAKRKDLLTYLRYCFYFLKKAIFLDNQTYINNCYDLDKCNSSYLKGWKFFIPKTMCKACFLQMINKEHLFGNLKTIFSDVDATILRKNFRRSRVRFNQRVRTTSYHSRKKSDEERGGASTEGNQNLRKKKGTLNKFRRKRNFRYNLKNVKNEQNISYDDKNGLISIKKNILLEDIENMKDNKKEKSKLLGKKRENEDINDRNNNTGEQLVTEIKIKTNEFLNDRNNLFNKNKNNINSITNAVDINNNNLLESNENQNNINNLDINTNNINIKIPNINDINIQNNEFSNILNHNGNTVNIPANKLKQNQNIFPNINNIISTNKEKKIGNIYHEIMSMKGMSNKIVMKLFSKLENLKFQIFYTWADVGDFLDKLNNSFKHNPYIIPHALAVYENHYRESYNEQFKSKKEFEEIFKKIKNDSIPNISKNLLKLREQKNLKEDDIKTLDEMHKNLNTYNEQICELEKNYDIQMKNYFNNFTLFLKLIQEVYN